MRPVSLAGLALCCACTCRSPAPPAPAAPVARLEKIDVHTHVSPGALGHLLPTLEAEGIRTIVNLSGGSGPQLEAQLEAARRWPGRVVVFCTPDLRRPDPAELELMKLAGCGGLKIYKALGLGITKADGALLAADDPSLDALFEKAGALQLPVAMHTGDPKAFWLPVTPENERYEELTVHPDWALHGKAVPSFDALLAQFERRVARHPRTTFIGLHFGNDAEDPAAVDAMLERNPNLFVDTAARVPELGRAPSAKLREIFVRRQDRIVFGTDLAAGDHPGQLVLGSPGRQLPTPAEVSRFWSATWRFFETNDRAFAHPTPIQGAWAIDGIGLPPEVLRKIYRDNAARLLGL
ncbi:MAG: amidohydrolase family protein [Myxococcaceae bacterium]|nr:amidohydrolase family protein [Myxococcaceae bacterium]